MQRKKKSYLLQYCNPSTAVFVDTLAMIIIIVNHFHIHSLSSTGIGSTCAMQF